ncbi:MAG TPA: hypothetical protein VJO15_00105 [Dehalococcoidia bacterium]|nr:hypothetical protein [Dehalococcoidia bacterium]
MLVDRPTGLLLARARVIGLNRLRLEVFQLDLAQRWDQVTLNDALVPVNRPL